MALEPKEYFDKNWVCIILHSSIFYPLPIDKLNLIERADKHHIRLQTVLWHFLWRLGLKYGQFIQSHFLKNPSPSVSVWLWEITQKPPFLCHNKKFSFA